MALLLASCAPRGQVARVSDGAQISTRFISPEAYELYLAARLAEKDGHPDKAARLYKRVISTDPDAVPAMTGLGRLICARSHNPARWEQGNRWFDKSLRRLPRHVPTLLARAECALQVGRNNQALRDARVAMALRPSRLRASKLLAAAMARTGHSEQEVQDVFRAWTLWTGRSGESLDEQARALSAGVHSSSRARLHGSEFWGPLDVALLSGRDEHIRRAAAAAKLHPSTVAVRAAALGLWDIAIRYARIPYEADPRRADAWAALLSAASVSQDPVDGDLWSPSARMVKGLSALGALVAADAMLRRRGPGAARALLVSCGRAQDGPPADMVARALWSRLHVEQGHGDRLGTGADVRYGK